MRLNDVNSGVLRIGVFYDGTFFNHVSNYYLYGHARRARIAIGGLHEFIREEVSQQESIDKRYCQIVDAHYFRGRMSAKQAQEHDDKQLYKDRQWDDVLIREGVTMHMLPMASGGHAIQEKGIDVWFALEAFELAMYKRFDVSVLVTGDGDFVPLVRKLNTLGTRVMLLAWDFEYGEGTRKNTTKTSQKLIDEVTYAVMMDNEIDARNRRNDPIIDAMFITQPPRQTIDERVASLGAGEEVSMGRVTGEVSNLHENGFGFLTQDGGGEHVFFHASALPENAEFSALQESDRFKYEVIKKADGKLAARNMVAL